MHDGLGASGAMINAAVSASDERKDSIEQRGSGLNGEDAQTASNASLSAGAGVKSFSEHSTDEKRQNGTHNNNPHNEMGHSCSPNDTSGLKSHSKSQHDMDHCAESNLSDALLDMFLDERMERYITQKVQDESRKRVLDREVHGRLKAHRKRQLRWRGERREKTLFSRSARNCYEVPSHDEDTDDEDSANDDVTCNQLLREQVPMDRLSREMAIRIDEVYQHYDWKFQWYDMQQRHLKRCLDGLDVDGMSLVDKHLSGSHMSSLNTSVTPATPETNSSSHLSASSKKHSKNGLNHPLYPPGPFRIDHTVSDTALEQRHINAALHMHDNVQYEKFLKEIREQERKQNIADSISYATPTTTRTQQRNTSSSRRKSNRKSRRRTNDIWDINNTVAFEERVTTPTVKKKQEVIIPTFKEVEEDSASVTDDTSHEDEYSVVFEGEVHNTPRMQDTRIFDLAGDRYPYHIHLKKELKEKKRIWRCWHGGSLKDPEDMTEEEFKIYEKKVKKKELPKMPEFKVEPLSYLFSPVPTEDFRRGNYNQMKATSAAFWKQKKVEEATRLEEERAKRNRKRRKRKIQSVYTELSDNENDAQDQDFFIPPTTQQRKRKKRAHSPTPETPRISRRKNRLKLTLPLVDKREFIDEVYADQDSEKWDLVQNTGTQMHWTDAVRDEAQFVLRFHRLAPMATSVGGKGAKSGVFWCQ